MATLLVAPYLATWTQAGIPVTTSCGTKYELETEGKDMNTILQDVKDLNNADCGTDLR